MASVHSLTAFVALLPLLSLSTPLRSRATRSSHPILRRLPNSNPTIRNRIGIRGSLRDCAGSDGEFGLKTRHGRGMNRQSRVYAAVGEGLSSDRLPKSIRDAVTVSSDKILQASKTTNLMRVVLKRGPMVESPKQELRALHEVASSFLDKAGIKNARFVVPKPEMAEYLRANVREGSELEVVDLSSSAWCSESTDIGALFFANLDELTLRPAKLAAAAVKTTSPDIPVVIFNPRSPWRKAQSREFGQETTDTVFYMEQGPDKETGTVMVTNMGDGLWQAWNINWGGREGQYNLLLQQPTEPTNDEIVAAVFEATKQKLWDETWGSLLDTFNVKGKARDGAMGFFRSLGGK